MHLTYSGEEHAIFGSAGLFSSSEAKFADNLVAWREETSEAYSELIRLIVTSLGLV